MSLLYVSIQVGGRKQSFCLIFLFPERETKLLLSRAGQRFFWFHPEWASVLFDVPQENDAFQKCIFSKLSRVFSLFFYFIFQIKYCLIHNGPTCLYLTMYNDPWRFVRDEPDR